MLCAMHVSATSNVAVALTANTRSAESSYGIFEASSMYCQVMPASKYPIKFEAFGRNGTTGVGTVDKSVVYNVNASGTVSVPGNHNAHKIKLTGWNVGSKKKNCIGWGKIY